MFFFSHLFPAAPAAAAKEEKKEEKKKEESEEEDDDMGFGKLNDNVPITVISNYNHASLQVCSTRGIFFRFCTVPNLCREYANTQRSLKKKSRLF